MSSVGYWVPVALSILISSFDLHAGPGIIYEGTEGPGKGKHVLLMAGDWEYRSEESLPMLGKILAAHHGFRCTVLFPMNPQDGTIDPSVDNNIPGLEKLATADLLIIFAMHLKLPDEQIRHIVDYVDAGKPVIGIRGSILGFPAEQDVRGGFGAGVLGGSFAAHHGQHGKESTRALTTTIGCSIDFESEGLRRLLVNGAYWCLEMENKIPEKSKVDYVGAFEPSPFGRGRFVKGKKPGDHAMAALP